MRWQDLKMSRKFMVGFGVVLGLLVLVAAWSGSGIRNIVGNAEEVIAGNQLRGEMVQREVDHLKWAGALNALLTDDEVTTLDIQTDHRLCGFGKWFYGTGRAEAVITSYSIHYTKLYDMTSSAIYSKMSGSCSQSPQARSDGR